MMAQKPTKTNQDQPQQPKRKVPLGEPLNLTDEDLERLSQITPEDIELAKAAVRAASPGLAKLMDAKLVEEDETKPPK